MSEAEPDQTAASRECQVCPGQVEQCAHWGLFVVRLYPPSRFDPRLGQWGVEGPGVIDAERSRREGLPLYSMYLPDAARFSGRHDDQEHATLDFEVRAKAMRAYEVLSEPEGDN